MRYGVIYKVTNRLNGKCYIGQTVRKSPKGRWTAHLASVARGSGLALHCAIRKYGEAHFSFEILCTASENALDTLEIGLIRHYRARFDDHGYNMTDGGGGVRGGSMSPENKEMHRLRLQGTKQTLEAIAKRVASRAGYTWSDEHRSHMMATLQRKWEQKRLAKAEAKEAAKLLPHVPWNKGQKTGPLAAETLAKLSLVRRGRKQSPEWISKRVAARMAHQKAA